MAKLVIDVAGHLNDVLEFRPETSCGDILDGVAFEHAGEGSWVIAFQDLEAMYLLARRKRQGRGKGGKG